MTFPPLLDNTTTCKLFVTIYIMYTLTQPDMTMHIDTKSHIIAIKLTKKRRQMLGISTRQLRYQTACGPLWLCKRNKVKQIGEDLHVAKFVNRGKL